MYTVYNTGIHSVKYSCVLVPPVSDSITNRACVTRRVLYSGIVGVVRFTPFSGDRGEVQCPLPVSAQECQGSIRAFVLLRFVRGGGRGPGELLRRLTLH